MNQNFYRAEIIKRFMDEKDFAEFDLQYQAMKSPTANNLPNKTFDSYLDSLEEKLFKRLKKKGRLERRFFDF